MATTYILFVDNMYGGLGAEPPRILKEKNKKRKDFDKIGNFNIKFLLENEFLIKIKVIALKLHFFA